MVEGEKWDDQESNLLNDLEKERYQSAIGMLLYLMHGSRPDLSFAVIKLSQYSRKPRKLHCNGMKRMMRYRRGTLDRGLMLGDIKGAPGLLGYFDSGHADNANRQSTCGFLFTLNGGIIS